MPWHDVAQSVKGDIVLDLTHHFNQLWHFIRYENQVKPDENYSPSLFEGEGKSVFSIKNLNESGKTDSGILKSL